MMTAWKTKMRKLTPQQVALVPEDLTISRGEDYLVFDAAPSEVAVRITRGIHVTGKDDTKTKSSLIKMLSAAKDADTPNVYTEPILKRS